MSSSLAGRATLHRTLAVGRCGRRHAASAGAFITMSAHVAAMAPGTNIGSASPVAMMGAAMDSTMGAKVKNDAVAYLESIQGANEPGLLELEEGPRF